ncbi:hypothetical protein JTE90_019600 [Oedothorax gibbosus]|uniref:Uncharacterized protein n=1 Tax=Oedothorax gibbosus TaxID=931172 RepID=A0AAV6V7A6_9ARAC|nr:hypothetical protein JTE90_019600 [Oedothorax gibbosus]
MPECIEKIVMVDSPPFYEFSERATEAHVRPQVTIQNKLLNLLDPKMDLIAGQLKFRRLAEISPPTQACVYKKAAYDLKKEGGVFKWNIDLEFLMDKYSQQAFAIDGRGSSDHEILIIKCPESARVTDEKIEAMLRYNPKTKLVTMEDTTHLLLFEKPKEFLEIVKNYLCDQELDISADK